MAMTTLDTRGLKCPQPTLKLTVAVLDHKDGDLIEILADCDTFEGDIQGWAKRTRKPLLWIRDEGEFMRARVRV